MHKLTDKEERFVQEYMKDYNATQAYKRAGYSANGARQNAHRLITKDYIQQAIEKRKAELRDENEDEIGRIRASLQEIAYSRVDPLNLESEYKYSAQIRLKALELLGKAEAMFSERVVHAVEIPELTPDEVKRLREKAALLDNVGRVPPRFPVESVVKNETQ